MRFRYVPAEWPTLWKPRPTLVAASVIKTFAAECLNEKNRFNSISLDYIKVNVFVWLTYLPFYTVNCIDKAKPVFLPKPALSKSDVFLRFENFEKEYVSNIGRPLKIADGKPLSFLG